MQEEWFGRRVEGAFSVSTMFRPSMSAPDKNAVLGATWNVRAELVVDAAEALRNG
jgi:hypothetical protein